MTLVEAQQAGIAPWNDLEQDYQGVMVYRDRYPVTPGHRLFVPENDIPILITQAFQLAYLHGTAIKNRGECDGFNIGLNLGAAAGQTVMYPHVHLIPRFNGDCDDPTGGIRGVIPGQANYRKQGYKNPNHK
jgi:diadenosine tetraphosphate (Ap4A) HIT family hydrolase